MNKNMEHSHRMKECKKEFSKLRFVKKMEEVATWYYQCCNVIVEITNIKYRHLPKHLFQRAQQHGTCKTPLDNNKSA